MNCFSSVRLYYILPIIFLIFLIVGCSNHARLKQKQFAKMSNQELLNYYHGVNERMKDVDTNIKEKRQRIHDDNPKDSYIQSEYFVGSNLNQLQEIRKLLLKELNSRGISP